MTHYPLILTPQTVPEIYFGGSSHSTTNTSSFSFTSMDFNVDNPQRTVVVAVNYYEFDTSVNITSITVGGATPTLVALATRGISGGTGSFIYAALYYAQPTGTSGTVAINFSRSIDRGCSVGVWSLYNLNSSAAVTSAVSNTGSVALTTQPGDLVVAATTGGSSGTNITWTNVTEDYDTSPNAMTRSGASAVSETNGTLTVSAAIDSGLNTLIGAVWR